MRNFNSNRRKGKWNSGGTSIFYLMAHGIQIAVGEFHRAARANRFTLAIPLSINGGGMLSSGIFMDKERMILEIPGIVVRGRHRLAGRQPPPIHTQKDSQLSR